MLVLLLVSTFAVQPIPTQPPEKPNLICRESENRTGSHIRTGRRCRTAAQWLQEDSEKTRRPVTLRVTGEQGDGQRKAARPQ